MIKARNTKVPHKDVRPPIIVVVADGHTHPPTFVADTRFNGDILEFPIAQIVIKRRTRGLLFSLLRQHSRAIQKVDVGQAVAVVIEYSNPAGGCLEDVILFRRPGMMTKIFESRLIRDVFKDEGCFRISNADGAPGCVIERRARLYSAHRLLRFRLFRRRLSPKNCGTEKNQTEQQANSPRIRKTARLHLG